MNKTITIASPISQREWILPYYLSCIYNIDYPKELIHIYWVVNNSTDNSENLLKEFKQKNEHEYASIKIDHYYKNRKSPHDDRTANTRIKYTYNFLSDLRNQVLDYVAKTSLTNYLLSIDSDILVEPDIVNKLLATNADVCAGLIWNGYLYSPENPHTYTNILNFDNNDNVIHISNYYTKNSSRLTDSKLIKVGATGAICLMSNEVCKKTRYAFDKQGEDIAWARDCRDKGYDLYCEVSAWSYHIMSDEHLELYKKDKSLLTTIK